MEAETVLDKIPSRVKYYLLDWKDRHMSTYIDKYGELRLRDLNIAQLQELFVLATKKDNDSLLKTN